MFLTRSVRAEILAIIIATAIFQTILTTTRIVAQGCPGLN